MNVTKNVINDLMPLYIEKECSADSRTLVEEYFKHHPEDAAELKQPLQTPLPESGRSLPNSEEMLALKKARRLVRLQSWILGLAIFFSLSPFSILHSRGRTYWLLIEAPLIALCYGALGVGCWIAYALMRNWSRTL
jgi:hypothetical protein